jgi:HK97 family phage prohead protease
MMADSKPADRYPDSEGPFAGPNNTFPLNTAARVRNAWARIHQGPTMANHSASEIASIKAKIRARAKQLGITLEEHNSAERSFQRQEMPWERKDMTMASDTPWSSFTAADYTSTQWRNACLIDCEEGNPESRDRYLLAVKDPSGVINRHGLAAAAAKIGALQGISSDIRYAAARRLVTLFRSVGDTPPDHLLSMAGSERSAPEIERLWTNNWQGFKNGSPVEVRSADGGRKIGGYAAMYNVRSMPLQNFVEIVEPSFFNRSRADDWPGVVCRFDHDNKMLLGTTASGTLRLAPDNIGLDYIVDLPKSREDVYEWVERRDVRNSSFAFQVYDDEFTYDEGIPVRHLISGKLVDVAPVVTPAYPDATVGLRNLARSKGVPYEEVVKLSAHDELRKLFVRTDNNGRPTKKKSGRQALLETLAMDPDNPIGK